MIKRFKRMFGIRDLILLNVGIAFSAFFTIIAYRPGFIFNLINFTFCLGIFHILFGFGVVLKNIGPFKAFGYMQYKRGFRRSGKASPTVQPLSFGEYVLSRKRYSYKEHFFAGMPFIMISLALLFFFQF